MNGVVKELKNGKYSAKVAQRIKLEVEVHHPDYKMQAFTIIMGEKPFKEDINLEKWPLDKLKTFVVKTSDKSEDSNDWCHARVNNSVSSCTTVLDNGGLFSNDFQSGATDTFTSLNNCQNFNITRLTSLEILRSGHKEIFEIAFLPFLLEGETWRSDYIILKSDNSNVNYKCINTKWIPADGKWHKFDCKLY